MFNIIESLLVSVGVGTVLSIPALILGYWLKKTGKAPNRSRLSLLLCIVLTFIKEIWMPGLSYGWFAFLLISGSTLGIYRMDWYWASKKTNGSSSSSP